MLNTILQLNVFHVRNFLPGNQSVENFLLKVDFENLEVVSMEIVLLVIRQSKIMKIYSNSEILQNRYGHCRNLLPFPNNLNLFSVGWLDNIWQNNQGITRFSNTLLKELLLLTCAMWNHRNNIIFQNHNFNRAYFLDSKIRPHHFT